MYVMAYFKDAINRLLHQHAIFDKLSGSLKSGY